MPASPRKCIGKNVMLNVIIAAVYFWWPKWTGRMYSEPMAKFHFWWTMIFVNLLFFPQHFLGLAGMPRRIPDYPDAFAGWNMVASIGAFITLAATVLFFYVLWRTFTSGEKAADNPWGEGATTLEWSVSSPPPFHTFNELPQVK